MNIYKNLDEAAQTVILPDTYKPNKQNHSVYKTFRHIRKPEHEAVRWVGAIANLHNKL
jgi:hypothetical protein